MGCVCELLRGFSCCVVRGLDVQEKWLVVAKRERRDAAVDGTHAGVPYDVFIASAEAALGANFVMTEEPTSMY